MKNSSVAVVPFVLLAASSPVLFASTLISTQLSVFQLIFNMRTLCFFCGNVLSHACLELRPVATGGPGQLAGGEAEEDLDEVVEDPGHDHVVVEPDADHYEQHGEADS